MKSNSENIMNIIFFIILAVIVFGFFIYNLYKYIKFKKSKLGKCVGKIEGLQGKTLGKYPRLIYSYSYVVNNKAYLNLKYKTFDILNKGSLIEVYYIENDPETSIPVKSYNFLLFKILGFLLLFLGNIGIIIFQINI